MDTPTESGRSFAKQNEIKKRASSGDDNIWCRRDLQVGLAARRGGMAKSVARSKTVRSDEALIGEVSGRNSGETVAKLVSKLIRN
jgi:hypothetical protein